MSVILSFLLTVLTSLFEINYDLNSFRDNISQSLHHFKDSHHQFITNKMWSMEYDSLAALADNEVRELYIDAVQIFDPRGEIVAQAVEGQDTSEIQSIRFTLTYNHNDRDVVIGEVYVLGNVPTFSETLNARWADLFVVNGLMIIVIFIALYLLLYRGFLSRLLNIAQQVNSITSTGVNEYIYIQDTTPYSDELSLLVDSLNSSARQINEELFRRLQAESSLRKNNMSLQEEINERKKIESALQTAQQTFLSVLDGIDATIYVADMQTFDILFMNKFMIESFGGDFVGKKCWDVFRGNSGPCDSCTNSRILDSNGDPNGVHVWQGQNPITGKWYINYDRAIPWIDGRLVHLQIATDITEYHAMESKLLQAQKLESIGRLAGGVAHDFNNMLSVILGNAEMTMSQIKHDSPIAGNVQEIQNAANRSTDLVRQLLTFARKQNISPKIIDLNTTTHDTLIMLRRLIGENITLTWQPGPDLWPIEIDPSQVDQILTNLCINARDAIEGIGAVAITTENIEIDEAYCQKENDFSPGKYVSLTFSDDGCGMSDQTLEHIFEPFFTTKDIGAGTGLGLATVYGIVKQNNGIIKAYSGLNQGTTLKLYFPGKLNDASSPAEEKMVPVLTENNETVLLVEDEEAVLTITTRVLQRLGYKVLTANSPVEALNIAHDKSITIDLLMTDVIMPKINGRDLAKQIAAERPELKTLFMSGYTASILEQEILEDNTTGFISKPFTTTDLSVQLRNCLDDR